MFLGHNTMFLGKNIYQKVFVLLRLSTITANENNYHYDLLVRALKYDLVLG